MEFTSSKVAKVKNDLGEWKISKEAQNKVDKFYTEGKKKLKCSLLIERLNKNLYKLKLQDYDGLIIKSTVVKMRKRDIIQLHDLDITIFIDQRKNI